MKSALNQSCAPIGEGGRTMRQIRKKPASGPAPLLACTIESQEESCGAPRPGLIALLSVYLRGLLKFTQSLTHGGNAFKIIRN